MATVLRWLAPASPTSGPGSRGHEIAHGLAVERRAVRVMRVQMRREARAEDLLDGRPSPRGRHRVEQGQQIKVLGSLEVEVEGQVGARSSGRGHDAGPAGDSRDSGGGVFSIRSLTDV